MCLGMYKSNARWFCHIDNAKKTLIFLQKKLNFLSVFYIYQRGHTNIK